MDVGVVVAVGTCVAVSVVVGVAVAVAGGAWGRHLCWAGMKKVQNGENPIMRCVPR